MDYTVLIPARLASTRLPNKPLADIGGVPMVVRVARQALAAQAARVIVATDHASILEVCRAHGVDALMTCADHPNGTNRLAEACEQLGLEAEHIVVNVQGDEPLIDPLLLGQCAQLLADRPDCVMATAAHAIDSAEELHNPNFVKVVLDAQQRALYFSRAPIPWWRDRPDNQTLSEPPPLRHIGLYAYRAGFLRRYPTLAPARLEGLEALEQLRVMWHGERIAVFVTPNRPGVGVDTAEDLERVRAIVAAA